MRILHTGALAAVLTIGAAAAQADELRLTEGQLDTVTAGAFALPEGFLDGLPELPAGLLDGLLPELPDGLPDGLPELPLGLLDGLPELPGGLPDGLPDGIPELPGGLPDFSNILSLIGDLPTSGQPPA